MWHGNHIWKAYKDIQSVMYEEYEDTEHKYVMFPCFGSLIGVLREAGPIPGDNDIDLCYLSHYSDPKDVYKELLVLAERLRLSRALSAYFQYESGAKYGEKINVLPFRECESPAQMTGQMHIRSYGVLFDLFPSWIDEDGNFWTSQWGNLGKISIRPWRVGLFGDHTYPIPHESEKLLSTLYGKNWLTPDNVHPSKYHRRASYLYELANT